MAKKFADRLSNDEFGLGDSVDVYLNDDRVGKTAQNTISVNDIKVMPGRRAIDTEKVAELIKSIKELGLINPITITADNVLVAGAHRLQAYKDMGLEEIPVTYLKTEKEILIELAEIDENLVRSNLHYLENGKALQRRKEIYETLYPETRRGGDRKSENIKLRRARFDINSGIDNGIVLSDAELTPKRQQTSESTKSFAEDTALKTGLSARKIFEDIQISENLTDKAKNAILEQDVSKKEALQLSRMKPGTQDSVVDRIAAVGSLGKSIQMANREAVKALPKFGPRKQKIETTLTEEEIQLEQKRRRNMDRVRETAKHLTYLDGKVLREHEIKSTVQINKGKNGEYTFRGSSRIRRGDADYAIPDGYAIYIYNNTERLILNEHCLICYLGTDKNKDVPVIIDGDFMYKEFVRLVD